jgi:hypothetical protein
MNLTTSSPLASPKLLLENEVLRELLRVREQLAASFVSELPVPSLVKPAALVKLANTAQVSDLHTPLTALKWPDIFRQLQWELSSSTTLRPLANLMGKPALLADPWNLQGGLWSKNSELLPVSHQHPQTQLYAVLRVDVVLCGSLQVVMPSDSGTTTTGVLCSISAGDAVILLAALPVQVNASEDARVWTAYFYSPDAGCCSQSAEFKQQEAVR